MSRERPLLGSMQFTLGPAGVPASVVDKGEDIVPEPPSAGLASSGAPPSQMPSRAQLSNDKHSARLH